MTAHYVRIFRTTVFCTIILILAGCSEVKTQLYNPTSEGISPTASEAGLSSTASVTVLPVEPLSTQTQTPSPPSKLPAITAATLETTSTSPYYQPQCLVIHPSLPSDEPIRGILALQPPPEAFLEPPILFDLEKNKMVPIRIGGRRINQRPICFPRWTQVSLHENDSRQR